MSLALLGVRVKQRVVAPAVGSPLRQLLEGLRYVRGHRRTRTVMMLFAITLLFTWTYQTNMPAFCQVGFMATAGGMEQESVPDELRGRVMGLWTFTFGVCFPIGSQLMGLASEAFGIRAAWSGGAVIMILVSLVVYLRMPPRSEAEAEAAAERAVHTTEEVPVVTDPVG